MSNKEVLLELKDLHKSFGNLEVIKGIDLEIDKGDILVIIGPSGSGKSTVLRCMNLLEEPTSGQIIFEGKDILKNLRTIDKTREKIGIPELQSFPKQNHSRQYNSSPNEGKGQD